MRAAGGAARSGHPAALPDTVATAAADAEDEALAEPWPRGVSREPTMRISDVLAALRPDFPAVTPSKLRFLEERGLVEPRRTPGGYRQYSPADLERLRYVLRQQRDRYLPLRVIAGQLADLDSGAEDEPLVPRLAAEDGVATGSSGPTHFTAQDLADSTGAGVELVEALVDAGVLREVRPGHLDPWSRDVVVAAAGLAEHGIDIRHLRSFRAAADRQVSVVDQVVAPLRGQRAVAARAHAGTVAAEIGELCVRLHTALLRSGVADLTP